MAKHVAGGTYSCKLFCRHLLRNADRHDLPIPPGKIETEVLAFDDAAVGRPVRTTGKFLLARAQERPLEGMRAFSHAHAAAQKRNELVVFKPVHDHALQ